MAQFTVTRQYRVDLATADLLARIVEADGTRESDMFRRLVREEAARRGLASKTAASPLASA